MKEIERLSSRSKPRRFGMSSRKSVSAEACNSSIRACACANWARRRRMAGLALLGAVFFGAVADTALVAALGRAPRVAASLRALPPVLLRLAVPDVGTLVFLVMTGPKGLPRF